MRYSDLTTRIAGEGSAAWDLHFEAMQRKNNGEAITVLSVGDPDFFTPTPIVEAPNVFSPNNDGTNESFFLTSKNVVKLELVILNRWGNVLFEGTGEDLLNTPNNNPMWDGKINGVLASEGVYFYKYVGYNINNEEVSGHGFLHLVSK